MRHPVRLRSRLPLRLGSVSVSSRRHRHPHRHRLRGLLRIATYLLVASLGASPAAAVAGPSSAYRAVLRAYQATGTVPPCQFTSAELASALRGIDTYGAQYFSDFASAVEGALSARASGNCEKSAGGALAGLARARPNARSAPAPLSTVETPTGAGLPLPLVLMIVLAGCGLLAAGLSGVWRWRGWRPRWAEVLRHGWAETGHRAGTRWVDFADWLRSGG